MEFKNDVNVLTTEELIKIYIDAFSESKELSLMQEGARYYKVENDILSRKMYRYEDRVKIEDETKTNNKLAHGFMHTLVDDKVNYLLLKPITLTCKDEKYLDKVKEVLGRRFQKRLSQLGNETSNKGIAWLHVYINEEGEFKMLRTPSEQIIPLWEDADHEKLYALIRFYQVETYEGKEKKHVTKIEYWTKGTVEYYVMQDGVVILDAERYLDDEHEGHFRIRDTPSSWGRIPFIYFKNNDFELPDLQFVKTLIDNYDVTRSDIANLLEDIKDIIYALRGYGGEDLGEFMRDMAYYKAIKLDEDGGLDKIEHTIDIDAAEKHYQQLKKDIFDFGQGVDKNSDKLGNSPSGIALKFIYSGLDLKCNSLEGWFKWGFEELMRFVNIYLELTGQNISNEDVEIMFNRDIAINESQVITDCQNSKGVISDKTIMEQHPWVEDVEEEIKQLEKENASQEVPMLGEEDEEGAE